MRFLLAAVNAKYIHSNPALYSLRAAAGEELGSHIKLVEYTINQQMQDILADLYESRPDCIGFSCYIWNWNIIRELLAELPKILPFTEIWLGGPQVSFDAPQILTEYPQVRGIMLGEGEDAFRELLAWYVEKAQGRNPKDLEQIPGLCLPVGFTPPREPADLNALPFPYQGDVLKSLENRIIYYESSRGCPFRCSYCLSSIDKRVRLRGIETVKREMQFFLDQKVRQVKFVDRTFNCDHSHAMAVWSYLKEHDNNVTNFHFEISADLLEEREITLLNSLRPGQVQLEIGVQSTNPETVREINRTMDVERLERAVAALRKGEKIHLHLDLIAGLPREDYDSFVNSFNRVYHMRPHQLQLGFLKVLKGTLMEQRAREYGIAFLEQPPYEVLYTKWLSYGEMRSLKQIEKVLEIYYNSNQFLHTIGFLEKAFPHPFALYKALADFYEKKGYFERASARARLYEILLEFACEADDCHREVYTELLVYDLYLRENAKSRPAFAGDLSLKKEQIRRIYREEEQKRQLLLEYQDYDSRQMSRMTHVEFFHYPVWDMDSWREDMPRREYPVLFDYRKRSPLDGQAGTIRLKEECVGETGGMEA